MSTWEDRMAANAAARARAADAERDRLERERNERLAAEAGPALPGEDPYVIEEGKHAGHRSHMHGSHGGAIICQCGACLGVVAYIPDWDARPEPCPVCTARGIPQG